MDIATACKDCVFATYIGKTQTGCALGRLDKYRAAGTQVDECYDEDKEFFVIRGRICAACRNQNNKWCKKHKPEDYANAVRKDISLRMLVIVPVLDNKHTIEDIMTTVKSIDAQKLPATEVIVALNDDLKAAPVLQAMKEAKCNWTVKRVVEKDKDGNRLALGCVVDMCVEFSKESTYYSVFSPGAVIHDNFISSLDEALNDRLERFVMLTPQSGYSGLVVQKGIHDSVGGNRPGVLADEEHPAGYVTGQTLYSVCDKVFYYAKVERCPELVRQVSELCPTK